MCSPGVSKLLIAMTERRFSGSMQSVASVAYPSGKPTFGAISEIAKQTL